MKMRYWLAAALLTLTLAGVAFAQYPIMDKVADRVIQKYQSSTCEQLWQQRGRPKSPEQQRAIRFLKSDPSMREAFFNRISGPVVNKMFECGMIP